MIWLAADLRQKQIGQDELVEVFASAQAHSCVMGENLQAELKGAAGLAKLWTSIGAAQPASRPFSILI
jgi:hypothetical protein